MKRITWVGALVLSLLLIPSCFAQSEDANLGDAARQQRKVQQPSTKKVYDNDSLPKEEHISVVGDSPSTTTANGSNSDVQSGQTAQSQPDSQTNADDDKSKLAITPDQSPEAREAAYAEWKKKVADQRDTISLLQREFDVLQREYRLRAAVMYADAGNRLRNSTEWDKEDRDYKDKIASKQKDLDRAKEQLTDIQEQARKAGVPGSVVE